RDEIKVLKDALRPTLRAFRDSSRPIGRSLVDSDAAVRTGARSVLEDLGRVRRLLKEYEASVPVEPAVRTDVRVQPQQTPAVTRLAAALRPPVARPAATVP